MAACRVRFTWFGTQKTLTPEQRATAAEAFDADGAVPQRRQETDRHPAHRVPRRHRGPHQDHRLLAGPARCRSPSPGVRLIKQGKVDEFAATMADYKAELDDAVANLDRHFGELKAAAAERLGSLFNPRDYPETLRRPVRRRLGLPLGRSHRHSTPDDRPLP